MDITITGAGIQDNIEAQVDPTQQALRVALRPIEHTVNGLIGGHYGIVAYSGTIAASLAANSVVFSIRWADPTKFLVLKRLFAWAVITGTPGTLIAHALEAIRATGFTAAFGANNTNATVGTGQKMRTGNMAQSLFSTSGTIQSCTTAGMTGQTYTLDSAGFATATLQGTVGAGASGNLPIYDLNDFGQHPIVLGANEGVILRNPFIFAATSTVQMGFQALWAEVAGY